MLERFTGETGKASLVDELCRQTILLGDRELAIAFSDQVEIRELAKNEVFIQQGEDQNSLFFILKGEVSVVINDRAIATRSAGTHVGEMALIDNRAVRSATVKAVDKAIVAEVSGLAFGSIANLHPNLWHRVAQEISGRLLQRNQFVEKPESILKFFIDEFILYAATFLMFFMATVFSTNALRDEKALTNLVLQTIGEGNVFQFLFSIVAIVFVTGVFVVIGAITNSEIVKYYVDEIIGELPRVIYYFGASLSGALAAVAFAVYFDGNLGDAGRYAMLSLYLSVLVFIIGFMIRVGLSFNKGLEKKWG